MPRAKKITKEEVNAAFSPKVNIEVAVETFQVGGDPSWRAEPLPKHIPSTCLECGGSGHARAVGSLQVESCGNCQGTGIK